MTTQSNNNIIGVFDSGIGGLSVLQEIHALLPTETLMYVADTRHLPYGTQSSDFITQRALTLTEFLLSHGAKAIVVACNTATAAAVATLRERYPHHLIIGMEPAVKPAVARSQGGRVGVLATNSTLASEKFARLVERHAVRAEVIVQPCPGLVDLVEAGNLNGVAARELVARYVTHLVQQGCDTLVLGCTHFSFLAPLIQEVAGGQVAVVDAGEAVARELKRRLQEHHALTASTALGALRFYTSGEPVAVARISTQLLKQAVQVERLPTHAL